MKKARITAALLVVLFQLAGCGGGNPADKPATGKSADGEAVASSPAEALSWLSASDRQSLETWKGQIVKSCSASAIFKPGDAEDSPGLVDIANLAAKTSGSFQLQGTAGEFLLLGSPRGATGQQSSSLKTSTTVDGKAVSGISAATNRNGAHCSVTLFGQPIADMQLASGVPVIAHFNSEKLKKISDIPNGYEPAPVGVAARVATTAFIDPVRLALSPTEAAYPLLSASLGIPDATIRSFFPLAGNLVSRDISVSALDLQTVPFNLSFPNLMGNESDIAALKVAGAHTENFRWLIRPPDEASAVQGDWSLFAQVHFNGTPAKGGQAWVQNLLLEANRAYADSEASKCFTQRFTLGRTFEQSLSPKSVRPSFGEIASPCAALSKDLSQTILTTPEALHTFTSVFSSVPPSQQANYGDWEYELVSLAALVTAANKNIAQTLDPEGQVPAIQKASGDAHYFLGGIGQTPALQNFSPDLVKLSFSWALHGVQATNRADILEAVKKAAPDFPTSTSQLLRDLDRDPAANPTLSTLPSNSRPPIPRSGRQQKQRPTRSIPVSWIANKASSVLQSRFPAGTVQSWCDTLDAAKAFADADAPRDSGFSHDNALAALIEHSVEEGWDAGTYRDMDQILAAAPLKPGGDFYKDHSSLARWIGWDLLSRKKGAMLDPAFGGRYARFTPTEIDLVQRLDRLSETSLKYDLSRGFWDPLWAHCDNAAFDARGESLKTQVSLLESETDFSKKFQIENHIRESLQDCTGP